ncbi:MAG: hypothetical protein HY235_23345 [Acidobacteria bacterium]|nr:hypothetical protein [Acidobacteriota bacterium]
MDWSELQDARLAVITELASRAPGGHIGRTALMKFCYLLQIVRGVSLGYRFTLYSYGPFDSSVLSDLSTAETLNAVQSNLTYYPGGYGYQIRQGEHANSALEAGQDFLNRHRGSIDWVLREFGSHGSADLELESTIIYADREAARRSETLSIELLAQRVRDVKPHFVEEYIRGKASQLADKGLLKACRNSVSAR